MTVKIVNPGCSSYCAHCHECGCDFTYQREDVHHNYVRGGDYVSCPVCGQACAHHGAPRRSSKGYGCDA